MKRISTHYECTCPAWQINPHPPAARTCPHLAQLLGNNYEQARQTRALQPTASPASTSLSAHAGNIPDSKRKRPSPSDEETESEPDIPAPKRSSTCTPPTSRLKTASFKPLLAHKWDLENGIDPTGWHISEKLDGV